MKVLKTLLIAPVLPFLASFTPIKEEVSNNIETYTEKNFYKDAYNFRKSNNLLIPNIYYKHLNIKEHIIPTEVPIIVNKIDNIDGVPLWIIKGIAMNETRSIVDDYGNIIYVDRRRGSLGERGPFQMRKIAFDTIKQKGEQFWKIEKDTKFAMKVSARYILHLYNNYANHDWTSTIKMYNAGPNNNWIVYGKEYYENIKNKFAINKIL